MVKAVKFEDNLEAFQRIVLIYQNDKGERYLGHTFFYNGRSGYEYLLFLYKQPLPENMGIMDGWNWLDDNSPSVYTIGESTIQTGVEDFLYANGLEKDWKQIQYYEASDFIAMSKEFNNIGMKNGDVIGFGFPKK
ncbi:MAG: hypothetical protein LKF79_00675 [Solobacterium sp.]|jgi:hypothetical protein|nr:hypothetical protein [Solobacterium sp.]MCH4222652.1 hypothetical protein [Solobacterium sp.]MCH4265140.1 hypothetical protein [Solobacterium sp.]